VLWGCWMRREEVLAALDFLEAKFRKWDEFNVEQRKAEGLGTDDDTHIVTVPPVWPTHGAVRHWADVMRSARELLEREECDKP
jgi:hypothetical protein